MLKSRAGLPAGPAVDGLRADQGKWRPVGARLGQYGSPYGATGPSIAPLGGLVAQYLSLLFFTPFPFSSDFSLFVFKSWCPKNIRFLPKLYRRWRLLTSFGRLVLVCNIVYVPIVALYHLYRLLFRQKKCIRCVISRYFESMTTRLMHLHYISQMWSPLLFLLELSLARSDISPVLSSPVVKQ